MNNFSLRRMLCWWWYINLPPFSSLQSASVHIKDIPIFCYFLFTMFLFEDLIHIFCLYVLLAFYFSCLHNWWFFVLPSIDRNLKEWCKYKWIRERQFTSKDCSSFDDSVPNLQNIYLVHQKNTGYLYSQKYWSLFFVLLIFSDKIFQKCETTFVFES